MTKMIRERFLVNNFLTLLIFSIISGASGDEPALFALEFRRERAHHCLLPEDEAAALTSPGNAWTLGAWFRIIEGRPCGLLSPILDLVDTPVGLRLRACGNTGDGKHFGGDLELVEYLFIPKLCFSSIPPSYPFSPDGLLSLPNPQAGFALQVGSCGWTTAPGTTTPSRSTAASASTARAQAAQA